MKIKNIIYIIMFLIFLMLVIIAIKTTRRSEDRRQLTIQHQQLKREFFEKTENDIKDAEKKEDYYSVVKLSEELLRSGCANENLNLKIIDAQQKIVELELAPVASKAKDLYKKVDVLKGVLSYYTLQLKSIALSLESGKDYEFSKDYDLAMVAYQDVIKQCRSLQALEIKRLRILKLRRSVLRLSMTIKTSFESEVNNNPHYQKGEEYQRRAELAYQLAKFDSAESDYNSAYSNMNQALSFLTQKQEFKTAQQKWNNKVLNVMKTSKLNSEDEFYDFLNIYASNKWTNLKFEIASAEIESSTNNFSGASEIYKNSLIIFEDLFKEAFLKKEELHKQSLENEKKLVQNLSVVQVLSDKKEILNEKLVINANQTFDLMLSSNVVISMLPIKSGFCSLNDYVKKSDKKNKYQIVLTESFWCSQSETTLAMFLEFLNAAGVPDGVEISPFGAFVKNKDDKLILSKNKYSRSAQQPMFCVDWSAALKFCEWLNEISDGKRPARYIFRLPTEAEWIYSAIYEEDTTVESILNSIAWYSKNSHSTSHKVCGLKPNEFGLYDMYGNVWEWCLDSYSTDFIKSSQRSSTNLVCRAITDKRVVKGGSWDFTEKALQPMENMGFDKSAKQNAIGFRVVLAPEI